MTAMKPITENEAVETERFIRRSVASDRPTLAPDTQKATARINVRAVAVCLMPCSAYHDGSSPPRAAFRRYRRQKCTPSHSASAPIPAAVTSPGT